MKVIIRQIRSYLIIIIIMKRVLNSFIINVLVLKYILYISDMFSLLKVMGGY